MSKEELGFVGVDIRNGLPGSVIQENPAGDDGMDVKIPSKRGSKGLYHGDHSGLRVGLVDGGGHHLPDGSVGESGELSQKLSMK